MNHKEFALKTVDHLILYGQYWSPENPTAVVALIHGIGEHSSRYTHWAERFNAMNWAFAGFDLRGHGNSEGKRGHIPSYERLLEDVDVYLQQLSEYFPDIPLFLYGHSMGGNITLGYAVSRKPRVTGAIVTAPWLQLVKELPGVVKGILRPLRAIFPGLMTSTGIDPANISRDTVVVEAYRNDPLVHDRISLELFYAMNDMGRKIIGMGQNVCCSLLLMHSNTDPICAYEASKRFADGNKNITFTTWEGLYHELHNEPEKEEVFKVVSGWMEKQLKKNS